MLIVEKMPFTSVTIPDIASIETSLFSKNCPASNENVTKI
jgi:hypothetical protein